MSSRLNGGSGAGTVSISGGALASAGSWSVTGATNLSGGTFGYNNATGGTTAAYNVSGGADAGTGLFQVSGPMSWTAGSLNGGSGTTRVLGTGTLALSSNGLLISHTLELAGFKDFDHLELHKLGMKKNSCPVTDERIAAGVA